jgi:hypothetical protein
MNTKTNYNYNKLLLVIFLIISIYLIFQIIRKNINLHTKISKEPFDFFKCSMTLNNINPKFKNEYLKFDNKHVSCGPCKNATLSVDVNTCPVDEYGSSSPSSCKPEGYVISSFGNPIIFNYDITSDNMKKFYCID